MASASWPGLGPARAEAHDDAYRQTVALATGRINGFDAKSAEALTLINRGSGQPFEDRFKTVSGAATQIMDQDLPSDPPDTTQARTVTAFSRYLAAHTQVRKLDDAGSWDQAVALATGTGAANRRFATFETLSAQALNDQATKLSDELDDARLPLIVLPWLLLLAGHRCGRGELAWRQSATAGVPMRIRGRVRLVVPFVVLAALLVASCDSSSDSDRGASSALHDHNVDRANRPARQLREPVASFAPDAPLPAPGQMPAGTFMAEIQQRGRLIAGVSADTLLFGYRNPFTGKLEGFDIDLIRQVVAGDLR